MIGPNGGTLATLSFAVIGDTRPPVIDDTAGYPTAVITKIYQDVEAKNAPFVVTTGDYMFASTTNGQAAPQLAKYVAARSMFSNVQFPAMGNHECTGATNSNCGSGNANGITDNYTQFMKTLLGPVSKTKPYYSVNINGANNAWTAKFVFIAANAWDQAQATWLSTTLSQPTTYTFVVRHERSTVTQAPGVSPSNQIVSAHPLTQFIVGHTHTYTKLPQYKEVVIGNGGAPLTAGPNFGYDIVHQRPDGVMQFDMYDYATNQVIDTFAVKPDGTPTP